MYHIYHIYHMYHIYHIYHIYHMYQIYHMYRGVFVTCSWLVHVFEQHALLTVVSVFMVVVVVAPQ